MRTEATERANSIRNLQKIASGLSVFYRVCTTGGRIEPEEKGIDENVIKMMGRKLPHSIACQATFYLCSGTPI